jgi:uncharacterized protein
MKGMTKRLLEPKAMEELLNRAEVGHLATLGPEGPYLVPLHFLYREGRLYFHCGLKGRKLDNIQNDPRVCFQVEEMTAIIPHEQPCSFNTRYASVLVEGRARLVSDPEEKLALLTELSVKYKKGAVPALNARAAAGTHVVEILPSSMSGKENV